MGCQLLDAVDSACLVKGNGDIGRPIQSVFGQTILEQAFFFEDNLPRRGIRAAIPTCYVSSLICQVHGGRWFT